MKSLKELQKIIEFNGKPPSAVFLVGGSSQMPGLRESLAKNLGLPKERVSIRDISFIENVEGIDDNIYGPDIVTPIGIAVEGVNRKYSNFIEIQFNGEEVRLFNTDKVKVSDILVLTGYNPRHLVPKLGDAFEYFVGNEKKILAGEIGEPAKIYVNGKTSSLNTPLNDGDIVEIVKGTKGKKTIPYLYDCIPNEKMISINDEPFNLLRTIKVNGIEIEGNPLLNEGDRVEIVEISTLIELLEYLKKDISLDRVLLNGRKVSEDIVLKPRDEIVIISNKTIRLVINGEENTITYDKEEFIFVDIFDYIDFDLTKPKGNLVLKVNGKDAEYMAPLKDGDIIQISWNK